MLSISRQYRQREGSLAYFIYFFFLFFHQQHEVPGNRWIAIEKSVEGGIHVLPSELPLIRVIETLNRVGRRKTFARNEHPELAIESCTTREARGLGAKGSGGESSYIFFNREELIYKPDR